MNALHPHCLKRCDFPQILFHMPNTFYLSSLFPKYYFKGLFTWREGTELTGLPETGLLHWSLQIDCHSVPQITLANGNYENIHFALPCFRSLSHLCWSEVYGKKLFPLTRCPEQVDRVPQVGRLPCLACKHFNVFSKESVRSWSSLSTCS